MIEEARFEAMPSAVAPWTQVGVAVSLLSGLVTLAVFNREGGYAAMTAGAVETLAGAGLITLASWLFYRYGSERDWLRARRSGLEAVR